MREVLRNKYENLKFGLRVLKIIYARLLNVGYRLKFLSLYEIPIVINNFNRLTFPLQLIGFLENCGFTNIVILDNNSSYPPLLKFYETSKYKVIRQKKNVGHLAFWKSGLYDQYKWNYFVYTDSDVVPVQECPKNFIEYFKFILDRNYRLEKIGFGIKIDDLPDSFSLKTKVVEYEKHYWEKEVMANLYDAPIDTTFALYRPLSKLEHGESYTLSACRTGFPYLIRHLPWYVDSRNLSDEENYYMQTCNNSSSMGQQFLGNRTVY